MSGPTWGDRWREIREHLTGDDDAHAARHSTAHAPPDEMFPISDGPPEHPDGQEDEPPDLRLALWVVMVLLRDLDRARDYDDDLRLRVRAVLAVIARLRGHLAAADDEEEV
jgi:hypothetical protein